MASIMNCIAPMVDGSDCAYRRFVSAFNVTHFWTPMYNVSVLLRNREMLEAVKRTIEQERFDVVFYVAGADPSLFEQTVDIFKGYAHISHFELNLGCAYAIAQRGGYGSYLDDEDVISAIFAKLRAGYKKVAAKIRIYGSFDKTDKFVARLVSWGCTRITLHARQAKQRLGVFSGDCLMSEALSFLTQQRGKHPGVEFIYNGGIFRRDQIELIRAKYLGVMCGQNLLSDPFLFMGEEELLEARKSVEEAFNVLSIDQKYVQLIGADMLPPTEVKYRFRDCTEQSNVFQTMSNEKMITVLKAEQDSIILYPLEKKKLQVKAIALLIQEYYCCIEKQLEWSVAAFIGHVMSVCGRDLMRLNTDLRDMVVGKKHRSRPEFQNENGPRSWMRFKMEVAKAVIIEIVRRMEHNLGVPEHAGKQDDL